MSDLIDTTEMYLRTIYELAEEGIIPLRARIAERLGHSGPTVSQTVARMERDGLLVVTGDRHLELTEAGNNKAIQVMRKHRLAERLLTDVIGLEWEYVHDEACRWEHVMSERVEKRLLELLGHPEYSPYGNPIPGLSELGERSVPESFLEVRIARLAETLQTDIELLAELSQAKVTPKSVIIVKVAQDKEFIEVVAPENEQPWLFSKAVLRHVFIEIQS